MSATGWGGKRPGAGRHPSDGTGRVRKMRSLRAFDEEWELIREFSHLVKHDPEKAKELLKGE